MRGAAHAAAGAIVGGAVAGLPGYFAGALIALAPDIDHAGSTISRRVPAAGLVSLFVKHRGFTHSLLAIGLSGFIFSRIFYTDKLTLLIVASLASHLICDMLTPSGIPLLWPLRGRWRLAPQIAAPLIPLAEMGLGAGALLALIAILSASIP